MESLIIPCKSTPPTIPIFSDISHNPIKSTLSLSKTHQPFPSKIPDFAHLNHLLKIGHFKEAIIVLDSISENGFRLNSNAFLQLLDCCIELNSAELGRELHSRVHLVQDVCPFVETKLVSMYAKCGCLNDARKVFDEMSERNLFSWSAMIGAYSREQRWSEVVGLFGLMMKEGILPDGFLFPKILQACGKCEDFETGRLIHSLVIRSGMSSCKRVINALLAVYVKCRKMSLARRFFEEMDERDIVSWNSMISGYCRTGENVEAHRLLNMMFEEGIEPSMITWNILVTGYNQSGNCDAALELINKMRGFGMIPDVFTWTSMISGLAQNNRVVEALELFREMLLVDVHPNEVTIASAVSACASVEFLEKGKELHSVAAKMGFCSNVLVGNSLIDMYSKCGEFEAARKVFDLMSEKDVYTWNSMIGGYCQGGYCGKAHELLMRMQESDTSPNVVTWNIIISGYIQNGDEDQAMEIFQMMGKEGIVKPNTSSWNSLISGYLHMGRKDEALMIFRQMQCFGYRPNPVTILSILPACGNLIAANKVKEIHACVLRGNLDSHIAISNSFIDVYGKSGNLAYSSSVFNCMSSKDIITWNSFIAGYVLHGRSNDALEAFDMMTREGYKPNRGTFISLILACRRVKLVEKGKQVFRSMTKDYQIVPGSEHYAAMVDLFGSSGRLREAIEFINCMETEPDSAVWDALLTASRSCGNIALIIHAGEHLLKLNPGNGVIHHLLSQAYMASERSVNTLEHRALGNLDLKKPCGCSLLEWKNQVYQFVSGDRCTSGLSAISSWLKSIEEDIKLPDSESMHYVHEEDFEEVSGLHSEKLALGFALLNTEFKDREKKPVAVGPWGGQTGSNWDDGVYTTVRRILITHGAGIDSIHIEYDKQGHPAWSDKHGGTGGYKTDEIKLAYPEEFLTSVHGYYGPLYHGGPLCVRSLTFVSNEKTHGPFGVELGTFFSCPKVGEKIIGFYGRCGWFLDAIGVYLKPFDKKPVPYSQNYVSNRADNSGYSVIHGSLGKDYDIVLAIKQRENFGNAPAPPKIRELDSNTSPLTFSRQSSRSESSDSSDVESKDKVFAPTPLVDKKLAGLVTHGPWGGNGGTAFDDGTYTGIRQIIISRNVGIVYMKVLYEQKEEAVWGRRNGGTGGFKKDKIIFDYPYEILTHITGFHGPTMISSSIIKSLTFYTTKGKYGPYGEEQGVAFTSKSKEGMIVGFHGRKGLFLDAIGVHVKEGKVIPQVRPPLPLNDNKPAIKPAIKPATKPAIEGNPLWPSKPMVARGALTEEPAHKIVKEPAPCGPGPWGGDGGKPWDDGVFTGIKQIFLTKSEVICSIQIEYDRNGQSVWSIKHGVNTGTKTHRIKLEYPNESLTCISGYYGPVTKDDHPKVIRSLTFYTSRGKYGPFGEETGTFFTSTTTEGKVVGFHGRSGSYLDAIGVHMQHWLGNYKQAKPSLFNMFG
uniref:Jacalin-type lectin domain-containing protein n=1 Tax=Chenopodium quinoa TaxID=63459 RepID=A0A803LKG9_CHEQI